MPKNKKSNFHDMENRVLNERLTNLKAELNDTQDKLHKIKINGRQKDRMIMELEQGLETATIDARGLQRQIKHLKKEKHKVGNLEKTVKSLQEMIQSLKTENQYLESAFDRLELQTKKFKKDAEDRYVEITQEKEELKDKAFQEKVMHDCNIIEIKDEQIKTEKECTSLTAQLNQLKSVYQKLVKDSINCREDLDNVKTSYNNQLCLNKKLEHELKRIKTILHEKIEPELAEKNQEIEMYKQRLSQQLKASDNIQEKFSETLAFHAEDIAAKNERIATLQSELATTTIKSDALKSEVDHKSIIVETYKQDTEKNKILIDEKDIIIKTYIEERDVLATQLKHHKDISLAQENTIEKANVNLKSMQENLNEANHTVAEKDKIINNMQEKLSSYQQDLWLMEKQKHEKMTKLKELEHTISVQNNTIHLLEKEKKECKELICSLDSLNSVIQKKDEDTELLRVQLSVQNAQSQRLKDRNTKYDEYIKSLKEEYSQSIQKMQKVENKYFRAQTTTTQYQLQLRAANEKHQMNLNKVYSTVKSISKQLELNPSFELLDSVIDISTIEHELLRIKHRVGDNLNDIQANSQKLRMQEIEMMNEKEKLERQKRMQKIQFDIDLAMKQCEYKTLKDTLQRENESFKTEFSLTENENKKIQSALEWDVLQLQEKAKRLESELTRKIGSDTLSTNYDQKKNYVLRTLQTMVLIKVEKKQLLQMLMLMFNIFEKQNY